VQAHRYTAITNEHYRSSFGDDEARLAERQLYLRAPDQRVIATASAWYDGDSPDTPVGRVHWVAIVPAYQGRGLAKPLLSLVCQRLRELGHREAILDTSTVRVPAVNLYRQFGFLPKITTPADLQVWRELAPFLKEPTPLPDSA
jgi:GNAT superfamily N-acetyltransferase